MDKSKLPHIVIIIPRGESVRNFLYSDTLKILCDHARVTLLSVIHDEAFVERFGSQVERIVPLESYSENRLVTSLRIAIHNAHFRWLWSGVARNRFETHDAMMTTPIQKTLRFGWKSLIWVLANQPTIEALTFIERHLTLALKPIDFFDQLFDELQPDLVFNTSHVHGSGGDLPSRVAYSKGIKTASFIFSWDNLTSRSRIMVPYHHYLVWTEHIKQDFLRIYPKTKPRQVHVTGTPQFDFHFKPENWLSREELAQEIGFDPNRPFVLYTTGIDYHFPEEHRTVELVMRLLNAMPQKPQLIVRTYVKGISKAMYALMQDEHPDVFFSPMRWDSQWFMATEFDQRVYTNMLRECALGINAASTVTLELMLHRKPIINLGFDPPSSNLPYHLRWTRHTDEFDHYIPVVRSDAVMVARSPDDMKNMLIQGFREPDSFASKQADFLEWMFGSYLDTNSGQRVAETLLKLASDTVE